MDFDLPVVADLLRRQGGVVGRGQLLGAGAQPHDIKRLLRRRALATAHLGVYVDHTGPLTAAQREWAAVLAVWPAALTGRSALGLPAAGGIEVAVDWSRRPSGPPGVVVRRTRSFEQRVVWAGDPPTLLPEHAVIDVAQQLLARGDVAAAYSLIANSRDRVSIWRVRAALEERERFGHRRILAGLVDDIANGSHSVLERGFLTQSLTARPSGTAVRPRCGSAQCWPGVAGRVGRPGAPAASAPPASHPWAHPDRAGAADRGRG